MAKVTSKKTSTWLEPLYVAVGGVLLVSLMALAFLWPSVTSKPHDVPVAIVGNAQVTSALKKNLESKSDGVFDISLVETKEEAIDKIQSRELYGAIVFNPSAPEVLTASANGPALSALINGLGTGLQSQLATTAPPNVRPVTVAVKDVVPSYKATFDIAALALPLVFGSMIGAILSIAFIHGRLYRVVALVLYASFVGIAMYLILHTWLNVLPDAFIAIAGSVALAVFASTTFISGLYSLFGYAGFATGAIFTFLIANPISGLAVPVLFLAEPWGAVGQWLTIGAGATLLREATYFPDSEIMTPVLVLVAWAVVGVGLILHKSRAGIRAIK